MKSQQYGCKNTFIMTLVGTDGEIAQVCTQTKSYRQLLVAKRGRSVFSRDKPLMMSQTLVVNLKHIHI